MRQYERPIVRKFHYRGSMVQWKSFWQAFQAEIDSDNALANINKFNYFVGQLEPNVLVTVAHSNENYPVLVNLLKERFESFPKITAAYMCVLYILSNQERNLKNLLLFYDLL
jgi:hypothetical protein